MFDVGWSELVVIGVVSLVVIGPKELPGVIRNVGRAVAKLRTMAGDFRSQFDDAMREADLAEVQKTFTDAKDVAATAVQAATNPIGTLKDELVSSVASINESAKALEADMKGEAPSAAPPAEMPPPPEPAPVVITAEDVAGEAPKPKRRKKPVEVVEAPPEPAPEVAAKPKRARKKPATDEGAA